MINLKLYRPRMLFLALAVVCVLGGARAQEDVSRADSLPITLTPKQAQKLLWTKSTPDYPPLAKVNYIRGEVLLELTVSDRGKVVNAHVLAGNAILAASALKATRRWIYHPLDTPSGPSGFVTRVELKFALLNDPVELTPRHAEQDLLRQVKPPRVIRPTEAGPRGRLVHMRLLVDDQGQVIDAQAWPLGQGQFEAARETLQGWTIRPAHWGSLPIPSYLEVDVPVSVPPIAQVAGSPGGR
jgi:TonB family protein